MLVCVYHNNDGQQHCYQIVPVKVPFGPNRPNPGINYPYLMHDATVVASMESLISHVDDAAVRDALHAGIAEAVRAMQARAGSGIVIKAEPQPSPW